MGVGESLHQTVLAEEVCEALAPCLGPVSGPRRGVVVDATCGLGGHTAALLERHGPDRVILFDRDPSALAAAQTRLERAEPPLTFIHAPFSELATQLDALGVETVDAVVADLGVSSMQLDQGERGFSFRFDAPLDMRMDPTRGPTAAELIATLERGALIRALREFGEEPMAGRIADAILREQPATTGALAQLVERTVGAKRAATSRTHPATRTFQALRILVNGELDELDTFLRDAPGRLGPGGRLAVISFHSLEDRRVKQCVRALSRPPAPPRGVPIRDADIPRPDFNVPRGYASGITPAQAELDRNPRSRSARLRVLERAAA